MSTQEVRSTPEALANIDEMQKLLNGEFLVNLERLITLGNNLSNGEMWRGRYANEFATDWSAISGKLMESHGGLVQLNDLVNKINASIMAAGGNA